MVDGKEFSYWDIAWAAMMCLNVILVADTKCSRGLLYLGDEERPRVDVC